MTAVMKSRWFQGGLIVLLLLTVIVSILAFAHTHANGATRCFASISQAKWPDWIGCAMAAHENLAGGLIGGAGALLAAWIAAVAVWTQIDDARSTDARNRETHRTFEERAATQQLKELKRLVGYLDQFLVFFDKMPEVDTNFDHFKRFEESVQSGKIVHWAGGALPVELHVYPNTFFQRYQNLNNSIMQARSRMVMSNVLPIAVTEQINKQVMELRQDTQSWRDVIFSECDKRQRASNDHL